MTGRTPTVMAVPPELHVLHGVNAGYKSQDLLQQPGIEQESIGLPSQRTACAATQGIGLLLDCNAAHTLCGAAYDVSQNCFFINDKSCLKSSL